MRGSTRAGSSRHSIRRGILAGLVGTSYMTAVQELFNSAGGGEGQQSWDSAPAPAKVARKGLVAVGIDPPTSWIPFLTHTMHWSYGAIWGLAYGAIPGSNSGSSLRYGALFGSGVWMASYAQLVPLGIYQAPWKYPPRTLAA